MLTPILEPPGKSENPKCRPRRANWKRNSLKARSLAIVSCWKVRSKSRYWLTPVREPEFWPKTWFCEVEGRPVWSDGETPAAEHVAPLFSAAPAGHATGIGN